MLFSGTKTGIGGSSIGGKTCAGKLGGKVGGACDAGGIIGGFAGCRPRLPGVPTEKHDYKQHIPNRQQ